MRFAKEKREKIWRILGKIVSLQRIKNKKIFMALEIRPIPVLTGEDAQRFVDRAEAAERNPQKVELSMTRDDIRKMMSTAKLY